LKAHTACAASVEYVSILYDAVLCIGWRHTAVSSWLKPETGRRLTAVVLSFRLYSDCELPLDYQQTRLTDLVGVGVEGGRRWRVERSLMGKRAEASTATSLARACPKGL
jgi:hypothetical protein